MMHHKATNAVRPPSLVDTLSAGFSALNRGLLVLLVPLAVNLWIWLGPRLSLAPLADRLRAFDPAQWEALRSQIAPLLPDGGFDLRLYGQFPLWRRIYTLVPTSTAVQPLDMGAWYIGGFLTLFGALLAINIVLTLVTAVYMVSLAHVVQGQPLAGAATWTRRIVHTWLTILALIAMAGAGFIVIGIPLSVVAMLLGAVTPALGAFVTALFVTAGLWFAFVTSFALDAVVMDGVGPLRAIAASWAVIRSSFWGVVRFFALSLFIMAGLEVVWGNLVTSVPGLIVALVSSIYVGAGLAAARLIFYRDRKPSAMTPITSK